MVVYFHRNPVTYEVFYVGIGASEKRSKDFREKSRSVVWHRYTKKYGLPIVEIVISGLTKEQAMREEIYFIKFFGMVKDGGILYNLTDGGETGSNLVEWKRNNPDKNPMFNPDIVNKLKGENSSSKRPEVRERLRIANTGKKASAETRLKQSLHKKGKPSNQPVGYKHSPEVIERMKIINKEIANRPEVKEKIKNANIGRISKRRLPVEMIDINTNIVLKTFAHITEACSFFGKPKSGNITSVIKGRRNKAFGYKWKLIN